MKLLTYYNINSNFTYENVILQLNRFWINEVKYINKTKIWLTIIVCNENNKSFILINNLPFNTSDFTDVLTVLEYAFQSKLLSARKDILKNITFKFKFDTRCSFTWYKFIKEVLLLLTNILILIILTYIGLIIYLEIFQLFSFDTNQDKLSIFNNNFECSYIIINTDISIDNEKICIFDPFIKLMDKSNDYAAIPSYFTPVKYELNNFEVNDNKYSILQYALYNQNVKSAYNLIDLKACIKDIIQIVDDYKNTINVYN